MARAATKAQLLKAADAQYRKLIVLIDSMSDEELDALIECAPANKGKEAHWERDKNLRDVLVHLNEWHRLLLNWTAANRTGDARSFLPKPYNWKTYGEMNMGFWEKNQGTTLEHSIQTLQSSHQQVMSMIEEFSDEELFTKSYFPWTGTTSLGSYCVSATSSHYDWAMRKLRAHLKVLRASAQV